MNRIRERSRIAINGKWLAQSPSGTQRYATEVVRRLARASDAESIELIVPSDAVVPDWAASLAVRRSRFRGQIFEQIALPWVARRRHLYSLAGPAPLIKRNQTVVMHDAMPFRFPRTFRTAFVLWYWLMYGLLSRTALRVMTVSEFSRSELSEILRVRESRFELAPCGADHMVGVSDGETRRDLVSPSGENRDGDEFALIVGNLAPHKNVMPVARALAAAGVRVTVVGGGQQVFRSVANTADKNLRQTGRISDAELVELYATAAVLVAPSFYEGFCIPIVEAGMHGCPSVFASGSAMRQVAGDGGVEFDPSNPVECAEMVASLLADRKRLRELGAKAKENALRFRWADTADAIFTVGRAEEDSQSARRVVKVLHVTEAFSAGTGTAIVEYAHAVQPFGIESHLVAHDRGSRLLDELTESPFASARIVGSGPAQLRIALREAVATLEPDVVHLHSSIAGAIGRLAIPPRSDVAVVYSPHCFAFERRDVGRHRLRLIRTAERVLARNTNAFVCVSPHEATLAKGLRPEAKVASVLNSFAGARALQMETLVSSDLHESTCSQGIVTVGRIAPQKNPGLFRDIIESLRGDATVEATWVGDGDQRERELLECSGIHVSGWLSAPGVASALADHGVYLHTAEWEASVPIAVLDAMNAGLPVVVKRNPAYRELLPQEWQFDDVQQAVSIILELRDPLVAKLRVETQYELISEYVKSSPTFVLNDFYRDLVGSVSSKVSQ